MDLYASGTEKYFQQVILKELVDLAMDPALAHTHESVIRAMSIIVVKSGPKSRLALPMVRIDGRLACQLKAERWPVCLLKESKHYMRLSGRRRRGALV